MCAERRRSDGRALGARLLVACALVAALGCGSEREPGEAAEGAAPEAELAPAPKDPAVPNDAIVPRMPPEPPAAVTEEIVWLLSLAVDQAQEVEVLAGTPILFSVSLTGAGAGPPGRLGEAGKPWHAQVALELAENRGAAPWQALALGPRSLVFDRDAARRGAARYEDAPEAVIASGRVHLLTLAIPPEEAVRMPVGRHVVRAVVLRPGLSGDAARVESDPVAIVVREPAADPAAQAALERRRALGEADFYLRTGRFEDAQRVSGQLVARDAADASAQLLLGDASAALHQDQRARDAYLAALLLVARDGTLSEPPQSLIERLHEVEERLALAEPDPNTASETQ